MISDVLQHVALLSQHLPASALGDAGPILMMSSSSRTASPQQSLAVASSSQLPVRPGTPGVPEVKSKHARSDDEEVEQLANPTNDEENTTHTETVSETARRKKRKLADARAKSRSRSRTGTPTPRPTRSPVPTNTAGLKLTPGTRVAAPVSEGAPGTTIWILGLIKSYDMDRPRGDFYEVVDAEHELEDDDDDGASVNKDTKSFWARPEDLLVLPAPMFSGGKPDMPKVNEHVLALYPDTTCFYEATVIQLPPGNQLDALSKVVVKFEEDDGQQRTVAPWNLVRLPNKASSSLRVDTTDAVTQARIAGGRKSTASANQSPLRKRQPSRQTPDETAEDGSTGAPTSASLTQMRRRSMRQ